MLYWKVDIMEKLKKAGYTTYKLRYDTPIGSKTVQDMRAGKVPGIKTIDCICSILDCQPGDIIGYKPGDN